MVYGEPLIVPGEFFPVEPNDAEYDIKRLRAIAGRFAPSVPTRSNHRDGYEPKTLRTCTHVFVRDTTVKPSLSPPYQGPYEVLQRREKTFLLLLGAKQDWVSIDRLKPAYTTAMDLDDRTYTRSGRLSRPPDRLLIDPPT